VRPLFLTPTVTAVRAALDAADARGPIAVVDWPRLGRQLGELRAVVQVSSRLRSLRRQQGDRIYGALSAIPLADRALGALIAPGVSTRDDWSSALAEAHRVVAEGGVIVLIDRVEPWESSRRALCSGLAELEQRTAGRTVVTSGRVFHLPSSAAA
jgi:hypothetical protein